jgi:hypothetical protein
MYCSHLFCILLAIIIHSELKVQKKMYMKNTNVKVHRKRLSLLVKLSVMRCENISAAFAKC